MNVKKIVAVLASAAMCSGVITPMISAEETTINGITLVSDGTSVVVKSCDPSVTELPSAAVLSAYNVVITGIGDYAFSGKTSEGCDLIAAVDVPDSVVSIGNYAFYNCDGIKTITIGKGVTSIGNFAFLGCKSLTSISVAEGNTAYKSVDGALYTADGSTLLWAPEALTSFEIADGTLAIANYAFAGSDITELTIPESVTSIGKFAFYDSSIAKVTIPASVASIGTKAFDSSVAISGTFGSAAEIYAAKNGNAFNEVKASAFTYEVVEGKAYITGFNEILSGAVTIPAEIDGYAVVGIKSLNGKNEITELGIGAGITSIDFTGLVSMLSLEKIVVDADNTVYKSVDGSVYSADGKTLFYVPAMVKTIVIPDGVTAIAAGAIANGFCSSITVPASVTSIGAKAFNYGTGVTVYGYTDYVRDYAIANGNVYVSLATETLLGDANNDGKITAADAYVILVYSAEGDDVDTSMVTLANADTSKDGKISPFDAYLVLQYDAEIITEF